MLWYVFVWFYLVTDHAPWWVYAIAAYATVRDAWKEAYGE